MKQKYLIGYTPKDKSEVFIALSQKLSALADNYCLGENSFPHITLSHFYYAQDKILNLWDTLLKENISRTLTVTFNDYGFITFDDLLFWVFLFPNNRELLTSNHNIVKSHVTVVSMSKRPYDPHLTLMNSKALDYEIKTKNCLKDFESITADFTLCLGECDEAGQLTKIIDKV